MNFYILDVFGSTRYSGNQLAVFTDIGDLSSEEMLQIAKEIGFSETTFILNNQPVEGGYPVRIFTPASEIGFAGHPTLGTAYIIKNYIQTAPSRVIRLNLKAGLIPVTFTEDILWMKQNQPVFGKILDAESVSQVVGLEKSDMDVRYPIQEISTGLPFTMVPLTSKAALKKARVHAESYGTFIKDVWAKGILVFSREGQESGQGLSSRVFVDYLGIPEDPATGSASGCLAAYLVKYQVLGSNSIDQIIGQGYEMGRPSEIFIRSSFSNQLYDIQVGGRVIEIAKGNWPLTGSGTGPSTSSGTASTGSGTGL